MRKRIDPLLTVEELANVYGIRLGRTTRWRLERVGKFPQRIRTSPQRYGYRASEILAWVEDRASERPKT